MPSLHLTVGAQRDLETIMLWYEQCREGLGRDFVDAIDDVLQGILASPNRHAEVAPGWRRALSRRFPYGVYYRTETELIWVVAVLHLHRDPDVWSSRT